MRFWNETSRFYFIRKEERGREEPDINEETDVGPLLCVVSLLKGLTAGFNLKFYKTETKERRNLK